MDADKERLLVEENEFLKRERIQLIEALEYYRKNSPNIQPPPIILMSNWNQIVQQNHINMNEENSFLTTQQSINTKYIFHFMLILIFLVHLDFLLKYLMEMTQKMKIVNFKKKMKLTL